MVDWQIPEEMAAAVGKGSPAETAQLWIQAVVDFRRWELASAFMTPELRLAVAQLFVGGSAEDPVVSAYDRDELAAALGPPELTPRSAKAMVEHRLWDRFATSIIDSLLEAWGGEFDVGRWGVGSRPRPVSPDHELVVFVDTGGKVVLSDKPITERRELLMRRGTVTGLTPWLVASLTAEPVLPGWPPTTVPMQS